MSVDAGLRQIFRKHLPLFDWQAIETGSVGGGVPDLNGCFNGVDVWIEMKKATHWRATIRPEQVGWAERRLDHGGRVFAAVRQVIQGGGLFLYHGSKLRDLCRERIDMVPALGWWEGGPAAWDWDEIAKILLYYKNNC